MSDDHSVQISNTGVKIMRKAVRVRAIDAAKAAEEQALLDLYLTAIGEGGR